MTLKEKRTAVKDELKVSALVLEEWERRMEEAEWRYRSLIPDDEIDDKKNLYYP